MRAREFTINIPINIKINGDGEPEVSASQEHDEPELQSNPIMVPPLQQHLELAKAAPVSYTHLTLPTNREV